MVDPAGEALGIYISVPFCRSKCTYCNFASGVYPASDHSRYVDRLVDDLRAAPSWAGQMGAELPRRVDTVYLGGGTPSLLAPELIARLFAAMRAEFSLEPDAEITVECAPGQLGEETLQALTAAGMNRVSLGVQSFIDREAAVSGRLHNRVAVFGEIARLRAAGIANLSVDLIAGLAGQTMASWQQSLEALIDTGVPHASVYMLEVDQDSRLGRELLARGARYYAEQVPAEDAIAEMYSVAIETLRKAGLEQYEISNFSRANFRSRHNLRYWQRRPYLGVGLDASSMLRAGHETGGARRVLRTTSTDDLQAYLAGRGVVESAWLSVAQQHEEAWFLGLRLNAGVEIDAVEREFGPSMVAPALDVVKRLAETGLLVFDGKTARLTARGQLLSNDVFQDFLSLESEHCVEQ